MPRKPKPVSTISDLTPDPHNPRKRTPRGMSMIADSLNTLGPGRSILIDEKNVIIAGNGVADAAAQAGIRKVLVVDADGETLIAVRRSDLTDAQKRQMAVADNRTAELAEWDSAVLAAMQQAGEVDLSAFWAKDEMPKLLWQVGQGADHPPPTNDAAAELQSKWHTERGQLWQIGRHRLLCADSLNPASIDRLMVDESADLVIADPPYGVDVVTKSPRLRSIGYHQPEGDKTTETARAAYSLWGGVGLQIWWGANYYADALAPSPCWLVWDKDHHGMTWADCELAWCNAKMPARVFTHAWSGMDRASEQGQQRLHPNQKPIALANWCIETVAPQADIIVDPFAGAGYVLAACETLLRQGRAVEKSPAYVAVILERLSQMGLTPQLLNTKPEPAFDPAPKRQGHRVKA